MFSRKIHRIIVLVLLLIFMGALPFSYAEAARIPDRDDRDRGGSATLQERSIPSLLQSMADLLRAVVKQHSGGLPPEQNPGPHPVEDPYGDPEEGSGICPHGYGCPHG